MHRHQKVDPMQDVRHECQRGQDAVQVQRVVGVHATRIPPRHRPQSCELNTNSSKPSGAQLLHFKCVALINDHH